MPPTVVILGAAGRFGLAATLAFAAEGWRVVAQVRPGRDLGVLPAVAGVEWTPLEITAAEALAAHARGATVVVHALNPAYCNAGWRRHAPEYMAAAIALSRLLEARLMFPGNVYNFGADMPARLLPDTPQLASDAKGRVRIAVEAELAAATGGGDLRGVVIRAGDFFGSGRGSWFDEVMAADLWRARVTLPGPLDIDHAWAYVPDLARVFVRVAANEARLPSFAVLGFPGHTTTGQTWIDQFTRVTRRMGWLPAGKALRVRGLPWAALRLAGLVSPRMQAVADMHHLWLRAHRIDGTALTRLIGSLPSTPLDQAVDIAVAGLYPHALDHRDPLDPGVHLGAAL